LAYCTEPVKVAPFLPATLPWCQGGHSLCKELGESDETTADFADIRHVSLLVLTGLDIGGPASQVSGPDRVTDAVSTYSSQNTSFMMRPSSREG
jgi:hypothetical protein